MFASIYIYGMIRSKAYIASQLMTIKASDFLAYYDNSWFITPIIVQLCIYMYC